MDTTTYESHGPGETRAIAKRLGEKLLAGTVIGLVGDLGAGKTVFTKGLCEGCGIAPEQVTSPTFVLVNAYEGRIPVKHMDLYRLDPEHVDLESLGFQDFLETSAVIVEWADRADPGELGPHMRIELETTGETSRNIRFKGVGISPESLNLYP